MGERPDLGTDEVLFDVTDGVAVVTLHRPDVLNAFSPGMALGLSAAYRWCDEHDEVRAVVLTGAGRSFCAGADLRAGADTFAAPGDGFSAQPVDPPAWAVRKPVLAAINGPAIGIGLTLALQCDLRYAATDAKLAIPQVRFGVLPDAGAHWTLRRVTSTAVATDLLLTGRSVRGTEAERLGLVTAALPADRVLEVAVARARELAVNCAPLSLALSKRLLWQDLPLDEVVRLETAYHRVVMGGADAGEGPLAWRDRRPPVWTGSVRDDWRQVLEEEDGDGRADPGTGR